MDAEGGEVTTYKPDDTLTVKDVIKYERMIVTKSWIDMDKGTMTVILEPAPEEEPDPNSQEAFLKRYDKRKKELRDTLEAKGTDYSGKVDRHANFKAFYFMTQGIPIVMTPLMSCLVRQLDKIQRAINLHINGQAYVKGETMADTLKDNAGYADIAQDIWEMEENED